MALVASLSLKLVLAVAAMSAAARGEFEWAGWAMVLAAVIDLVDAPRFRPGLQAVGSGRRLTIVVNALCFGLGPAVVAHQVFLRSEPWGWALAVLYAIGATTGIAKSRLEPDRRSRPAIQGLPASAAGALLVTIYPFFNAEAVAPLVGGLPSAQEAGGLVICLFILMVGPISYPVAPRVSFRRGSRAASILFAAGAVAAIAIPQYIVFPAFAVYVFWGIAESMTPVLADGILEGNPGDEANIVQDDSADRTRVSPTYRARSTWE